jgi:hypothetical protein
MGDWIRGPTALVALSHATIFDGHLLEATEIEGLGVHQR